MPKLHAYESAHGSGGRRGRGRRIGSTLSEINVVPLIDVMLVLLIIFMVTAPMMQRGLDVNIPQARRAQPIADERLFVTVPLSYRSDHLVRLGDETVRIEILHERIRQALLARTDKEVFLRGDGGVMLQELIDVMDKLKEGGVEKVGIVARLPEG
ncbi:MAG: biopolymer transporter ExbD [Acidobacteria bacterium]|nr:biopolymer transporter ExbD [Acidobacteriota bacterium]